jgi:hypothetical protein
MIWFKIVHTYKIYHRTKFRGFSLTSASFASTSEVWALAILEWLKARDYPQRHNLQTEFHKNLLIGSQVIGLRDTQTEWWSHKPHYSRLNTHKSPAGVERYWLLLRAGIVRSVPCNCSHFLIYYAPYLSSRHSRSIHQSSLFWLQQRHLVAKLGWNWARNGV